MKKTIVKKQLSVHGIHLICEENKNKQILEIQFYNFYCIAILNTDYASLLLSFLLIP